MRSVISTTYDDQYLFFLPITTWLWNRLGVDVICFVPLKAVDIYSEDGERLAAKWKLITKNTKADFKVFFCPENKEATYSQCSRLYGACLDLPEDEVLIVSDCDMANFKIPPYENGITIFGSDLVPDGQYPMCYASGTVKEWRVAMKLQYGSLSMLPGSLAEINVKTYQQCLDELLGEIECEHMRGNYWGKDQQTLWENTRGVATLIPRARPGTQFAESRVDRDDINWRSYVNDSLIDAHLWRPGYEENNFNNILELLQMKYPSDDFTWLVNYRNEYIKLIQ